MVEALF